MVVGEGDCPARSFFPFADADTDSLNSFDSNHRAFTGPKDADFVADIAVLEALEPHIPTDSELGLAVQPMMGKRQAFCWRI